MFAVTPETNRGRQAHDAVAEPIYEASIHLLAIVNLHTGQKRPIASIGQIGRFGAVKPWARDVAHHAAITP